MKIKILSLITFLYLPSISHANWLVGLGSEYRWLHFYGQSTGVPTYRGLTFNPEIKKDWGGLAVYGGYGFGVLPNTANSQIIKEDFKYRAFSAGLEFTFSHFFVRLGAVRHYSKDEVSGYNVRTIDFNGWGGHIGTGITGYISSAIQYQLGVDLQHARFEKDPQANLGSKKDLLSYAGYLRLSWILTSSKRPATPPGF